MATGTDLTAYCSSQRADAAESGGARLWRGLRRWFPFVFPWSGLRCMTGVVVDRSGVTVARGRQDGRRFKVEDVIHRPGPDLAGCLEDLGSRYDGPACASLPRHRTLVRHFRVPAESEAEVEAMLPHLLAGELPLSIEHFSWVWSRPPTDQDGYSLVTVYVSRNDQLEAFLAPLVDAGLNVVNLVPEGWSWARVASQSGSAGGEADEPVSHSFVIQVDGAPYLIVERGGQLLFDMMLPGVPGAGAASPSGRADALPEDGGLAAARERYAELFGEEMPPPRRWSVEGDGDGSSDEIRRRFATAVAAEGMKSERSLLPPSYRRRCRRRTLRDAAGGLARLGLVAAVIWMALAAWQDVLERRYLASLEAEIAEQAAAVAVLEQEHAAIRESNRERTAGTGVLQALTSLRQHVRPPIYIEHVNYVESQGVTLRGGAPGNDAVLEMMERLAGDPLWRNLRVMQLRSEAVDGADRIHFVIEGRTN
jgi:hypothetical protein